MKKAWKLLNSQVTLPFISVIAVELLWIYCMFQIHWIAGAVGLCISLLYLFVTSQNIKIAELIGKEEEEETIELRPPNGSSSVIPFPAPKAEKTTEPSYTSVSKPTPPQRPQGRVGRSGFGSTQTVSEPHFITPLTYDNSNLEASHRSHHHHNSSDSHNHHSSDSYSSGSNDSYSSSDSGSSDSSSSSDSGSSSCD